MAPLAGARGRVREVARDRRFRARARRAAAHVRGPPDAASRAPSASSRADRRGAHRAEARGPAPHRRAQAQQRARPGPAGAADGEEARRRRDRGGTARRRHGGGGRAARPLVPVYMGTADMAPPGAQRLAHAAAGRRGRGGRLGLADAQGRDQRGDAGLDRERRGPPTTSSARRSARTRTRRSSAISRPVIGREARAQFRRLGRATPRSARRAASAAAPMRSVSSRRSCDAASRSTAWRRAAAGAGPASTRRASPAGPVGVLHGTRTMLLQDAAGQIAADALGLRRARLSGRGTRARRSRTSEAGQSTPVSDDEALDAFALLCETEGILPALESAHAARLRGVPLRRRLPRSAWILVNLSGRGDKDLDEYLRARGQTAQ